MATIKDVAVIAGVLFTTVSHLVNNSRPVSVDVRAKVERAIRELDYVPSAVARSLKGPPRPSACWCRTRPTRISRNWRAASRTAARRTAIACSSATPMTIPPSSATICVCCRKKAHRRAGDRSPVKIRCGRSVWPAREPLVIVDLNIEGLDLRSRADRP